jgi:glycerol kinase
VVRATLESLAYQTRDVIQAMEEDSGLDLRRLKVDGGATVNNFLMQFQSDILGRDVVRPRVTETTALGAAYLAGLAVGFWKDVEVLKEQFAIDQVFEPRIGVEERNQLYKGWQKAVKRTMKWSSEDSE